MTDGTRSAQVAGSAAVHGAVRPPVEPGMPPPLVLRLVKPVIRTVLRSPLHGALSGKLMLLSVRGRRTGRTRTVVVGRHESNGAFLVSASGSWRHNLRGGAPVRLVLGGTERAGYAEVEDDPDRVAQVFKQLLDGLGRSGARELGLKINVERPPTAEEIGPAVAGRWIARVRLVEASDA